MVLSYNENFFSEIKDEDELDEINGGGPGLLAIAGGIVVGVVVVVVVIAAVSFVAGVVDGYNG